MRLTSYVISVQNLGFVLRGFVLCKAITDKIAWFYSIAVLVELV